MYKRQHEVRLEQALLQMNEQINKKHVEIRDEVAMQVEQERTNNKKLFQDYQVETNHKIQDNTDKITELNEEICVSGCNHNQNDHCCTCLLYTSRCV